VTPNSDNGGVHTNSGIPNRAAYKVAAAIGPAKMEQIWYRTLTLYLTSGSQFTDARDASVQAAIDLYGNGSPEVTAVVNGFSSVGIGGSQLSDTTARIEIDHTYRGDLIVTLGVGDPNSPAWSTVVSNRSGGSADNIYQTVDIAAAVPYLPPGGQNRWFLKVRDEAGYDTGSIKKFTITDHDTTYAASDLPMPVNDYQTSISYIPSTDDTPPTVVSRKPQPGASLVNARGNIEAVFSESILAATVTGSSFSLKESATQQPVAAAVSYNSGARKAVLNPSADLKYSTVYEAQLTTAITDPAGNPLPQTLTWSFTTSPEPKLYYFTWYDMNSSPSMSDWIVMGNPGGRQTNANFDVYVNASRAGSNPITVSPGSTKAATYPGTMGGPVSVAVMEGQSEIVSKRTLYGDSLEEINGLAAERLDSHYYFTWYDTASPGARDWILISNPGASSLQADVYISGRKMNGAPYNIGPGQTLTPEYAQVIGGPVEVVAYQPGNPQAPRDAIVSQRVLWDGDFNEVMGIPAAELSADYLFTWYDMQSAGSRSWILVSNPHANKNLAVEIWIGGARMQDPATGRDYFVIPAGQNVTPTFPGTMNGPVRVRGFDAQSYNPANPGTPNLSFYTTQRSIFTDTFEEVLGYSVDQLSPSYFYSWYDQQSPGSQNWVLVSNPGAEQVKAEVWINGARRSVLTINPGSTITPAFNGLMGGPVEIRGYLASTYNYSYPGAPNADIFSSQRVMWKGHFNELTGAVLD
jgi:subtilisin-like proprotein convertase family protein